MMVDLSRERAAAAKIGRDVLSASYTEEPWSEALTRARSNLWRSVRTLEDMPLAWPSEVVLRMEMVRDDIDAVAVASEVGPDPRTPWWKRWLP